MMNHSNILFVLLVGAIISAFIIIVLKESFLGVFFGLTLIMLIQLIDMPNDKEGK